MTNRTAWPTVASGDAWSASQHNTYGRDNDLAYWVYQAAGDLAYASSSAALARLAIGANGTVLASNGSAPIWSNAAVNGLLNIKGTVDFSPAQTFSSTWADITGATLTLTLGATCTILVLAEVTGNSTLAGTGRATQIRAMVDGVADAAPKGSNGSANPTRLEAQSYIYSVSGIAAGARIVKLQAQADSGVNEANYVASGRLIAIAFVG